MPQAPCPYCGHPTDDSQAGRCASCNGLFEPLSRKATQLAMGPWYIRDENRPFMPGFSEAILRQQVASGRIKPSTIVRGPTTNQFWVYASSAPGLSRLLGRCHACSASVTQDAMTCGSCNADLSLPDEVDRLGLSYVEPAERAAVQQEIETQRTAPPPRPKPTQDDGIVDPDHLKPVAPEPIAEEQASPVAEEYEHTPDIAEDLWHAMPDTPVRGKRKKRSGPEPLVMVMGVMFLCLVGILIAILILGGEQPGDSDRDLAQAQQGRGGEDEPLVERDAEDVERIRTPITQLLEQLSTAGVPTRFESDLDEVRGQFERAREEEQAERFTQAFAAYVVAENRLAELTTEIAEWERAQQLSAQAEEAANELIERVQSLRTEAGANDAAQYAPVALENAQQAYSSAQAFIDEERYDQAVGPLGEAEAMYQMAVGRARAGQAADASRQALFDAMSQSYPEAVLRERAPDDMNQFDRALAQANNLMTQRAFDDAANGYDEAADYLNQAVLAVDFERYRKVYAYEAGYHAAGVLLSVASQSGIAQEELDALTERYALLRLENNPASALAAGDEADYSDTADALVHAAREAILTNLGEEARASYQVGFQMQIISQTLATDALSREQQRRIAQTLDVIEQQATAGAWDVGLMRPAINAIRRANRDAGLDAPPLQTREAWQQLLQPMQDRTRASRIMEPTLWPSTGDDPELFGGLGQ